MAEDLGPVNGLPVGDPVPGWTPRPRAVAVELTGRYVAVEPLGPQHVAELHAALCGPGDADLWTYRPTDRPADVETMAALVASMLAAPELETMVLVPHGDTACGMASYTRIEPVHGQVEVAAVLFAHRLQRTTAATEAIHLLMAHALDDLGYRRFEWKCDSLNEPSRRAAARLGFTYEGRFRQHLVIKGRNRDTDWFSVADAEWPAVAAAHRRWLDPANHDAEGRQRSSLSSLTGSITAARQAAPNAPGV